jgi:hypothetical protein
MNFVLKVPPKEFARWAALYGDDYDDSPAVAIGRQVRETAKFSYDDFLALAEWKTARSKSRCRHNSRAYVAEITHYALSSVEPRFKIEALRLLDGVDWATASVILHFCDREPWPILDVRAFWSLGQKVPSYITYPVWEAYTAFTRAVAAKHGVSMRTLDRALWSYSRKHQGPVART